MLGYQLLTVNLLPRRYGRNLRKANMSPVNSRRCAQRFRSGIHRHLDAYSITRTISTCTWLHTAPHEVEIVSTSIIISQSDLKMPKTGEHVRACLTPSNSLKRRSVVTIGTSFLSISLRGSILAAQLLRNPLL